MRWKVSTEISSVIIYFSFKKHLKVMWKIFTFFSLRSGSTFLSSNCLKHFIIQSKYMLTKYPSFIHLFTHLFIHVSTHVFILRFYTCARPDARNKWWIRNRGCSLGRLHNLQVHPGVQRKYLKYAFY